MERSKSENVPIWKWVQTVWAGLLYSIPNGIRQHSGKSWLYEALRLQWIQICRLYTWRVALLTRNCWFLAGLEKDPYRRRSPTLPLHLLPGGVWRRYWTFLWLLLFDNLAGDKELFHEIIHLDVVQSTFSLQRLNLLIPCAPKTALSRSLFCLGSSLPLTFVFVVGLRDKLVIKLV